MSVPRSVEGWSEVPDSDLLASEVTFQSVFKFHPEAMMLFHGPHLVYVNKAACDLFMVKSGADFMMPGLDNLLIPASVDGSDIRLRFGHHIAEPERMKYRSFQWPCITQPGRTFTAQIAVHPIPAMPFDLTLVRLSALPIS
ncbi:MAG: hypothetical protein SFW63_07260 [Alphaproteobacteria bacterium]|nr:hypothetical protein [Alphaproteobacteria bacterium]